MPFRDLIGQAPVAALLLRTLKNGDGAHVHLFAGPEGVGKTTAAIALAQALCCKNPQPVGDACGLCIHCTRIAENQHPDIVRIAPDGEQTKIWQLWSRPGHPTGALETLPFAPVSAPIRFYLIEKAETLNDESANSLLKALEEPPGYVRFALCAPAPDTLLPTIRSRCRIIRLAPVATNTIADWLQTKHGISAASAAVWAAYSQGSPGRALKLAQSPELEAQRNAVLRVAERIAQSSGIAAFRLAEELRDSAKAKGKKADDDGEAERAGRGDLARVLDMLALWYGDLLRVATAGADVPLLHAERRADVVKSAEKYKKEQIIVCLETLFQFRGYITRNANPQIATEALLLRLIPRRTAS